MLSGWNGTGTHNNLQPLISLEITYSFSQTGEDISFGDDYDDDNDDDDDDDDMKNKSLKYLEIFIFTSSLSCK